MDKLLFLSILAMAIFVPIVLASDSSPRRGLRRTFTILAVFNLAYLFAILYVYPRLAS